MTNVLAVKRQLLTIRWPALAGLAGVGVGYSWTGKLADSHRQIVYGGSHETSQDPAAYRRAGGRQPCEERAALLVHIRVRRPDSDAAAAEARVIELGQALEHDLATDPTLGGFSGLLSAFVAGHEMDEPSFDDDGVESFATYTLNIRSYLT